jgi:hypothetical protein
MRNQKRQINTSKKVIHLFNPMLSMNQTAKIAEPGSSLDAEKLCGADAASSLVAQVTLVVSVL